MARGRADRTFELSRREFLATTGGAFAGMAAFGATLFESSPPSRDEIVEELTQMTLHGFLHR